MARKIIETIDSLLMLIVMTSVMFLPDALKNNIIFCALTVSIVASYFIKRRLEKLEKLK